MRNLKFSIIIPAHNEEGVIARAIKSVLNQTFQNFEIIVSNDGSTDKTREIVEKLMKKDKRIKLLNRKKAHSAAFARNRGAEKAKGEIFIFLDADTYINKVFLEEISKKVKKDIDAVITICLPLKENFMNRILSGFLGPPFKLKLEEGIIYNKNNCHEAGSMFFCITKKAYKSLGGYNEQIFYYEDENFTRKFYDRGFKSTLAKKAIQYFELPSSFKEFVRQCKWIGKGINTLKDKKERKKQKAIWFLKSIFLLFPLLFLFNINLFLLVFLFTAIITYLSLVLRNKKPLLSLIVLAFTYIKTFLVSFNILRFSK